MPDPTPLTAEARLAALRLAGEVAQRHYFDNEPHDGPACGQGDPCDAAVLADLILHQWPTDAARQPAPEAGRIGRYASTEAEWQARWAANLAIRDAAARTPDVEAHLVGQTLLRMGNRIADLVKERDALLAQADAADLMDVERLTRVLYDWMPDGAEVAVGFDGESRHMTGSDLARYLFDRANEYAALAPTTPTLTRKEADRG